MTKTEAGYYTLTKEAAKVGDRVMLRGKASRGTIATILNRPGWVEILWDDGSEGPKIAYTAELIKI